MFLPPIKYVCTDEDVVMIKRACEEAKRDGSVTVGNILRFNGGADALRGRIMQQRPGIARGGGLDGYFMQALRRHARTEGLFEALPLKDTRLDSLQLLWDTMDMGDFDSAAMQYLSHCIHHCDDTAGHPSVVRSTSILCCMQTFPVGCGVIGMHLVPRGFEDMPEVGRFVYGQMYGHWQLACGLELQFDSLWYLVVNGVGNSPFMQYVRLLLIEGTAARARCGEAVWFECYIGDWTWTVDSTGAMYYCPGFDSSVRVFATQEVRGVYDAFCATQEAAAVALVKQMPDNIALWQYLWTLCPTVTDVEVIVHNTDGTLGVEMRNVKEVAARYINVAFVMTGTAKPHWTPFVHARGCMDMVRGTWPDSVDPNDYIYAISVQYGKRRHPRNIMGAAEQSWTGDKVMYVPSNVKRLIAVYLLGKQRLWAEGRLGAGPEVHTAVEEALLENLMLADMKAMCYAW